MTTISDEFMSEMLQKTKNYSIVILKPGVKRNMAEAEKIIWEHGRRNFALRAVGKLSVVCPVSDGRDLAGIGIFNASIDEVKGIMDDDPAVKAEILAYQVYPCRSFPGDSLPG